VQTLVVTTITTTLDIDTLTPSHDISISHEGVLPQNLVYALAKGAANSVIASIGDDGEPLEVDTEAQDG
jgi:L-aminopeptidase/D-esterase-like protein